MSEPLPSMSWADVIDAWADDPAFRASFTERLAEQSSPAFAWETAPVCENTLGRPFEDIVIDSPALARVPAEPSAFAEHFSAADRGVCTFANLGGDAVLIAPTGGPDGLVYPHLAAFLRSAPADQRDALWIAVALALRKRLFDRPDPVWVNTAGLGVHWLHVRLDDRPKYYRHAPFRRFVPGER